MNEYKLPIEKILEIGKSSLNDIDYNILERYIQGKTTIEIVSELSDYAITPYLVWNIAILWLNYFRNKPVLTSYSADGINR